MGPFPLISRGSGLPLQSEPMACHGIYVKSTVEKREIQGLKWVCWESGFESQTSQVQLLNTFLHI